MQPKHIFLASLVIALCVTPLLFLLGNTETSEMPAPLVERASEEFVNTEESPETVSSTTSNPLRSHVFVVETAGTLESVMQTRRTEGSLIYTSRLYPTLGSFVESIGGLKNAGGSYWMLYINGSLSSSGMSQAEVERGDRIEWRYE